MTKKNGNDVSSNQDTNTSPNTKTTSSKMANTTNTTNTPTKKNKNYGSRYMIDTIVGCFAGFALAWFITPLDVSVMQAMSGTKTMPQSIKSSATTIFTKFSICIYYFIFVKICWIIFKNIIKRILFLSILLLLLL